jgi:Immunity protein 35
MDQEQAKKLAWNHISSQIPGRNKVIVETIEKEYGWIFHWQSKEWAESGNMRDMLIGNCPVLITRKGELVLLPTAIPLEESLRRYESGLPLLPRPSAKTRQDQ